MQTNYFGDSFFENLPDDALLALMAICQEFMKLDREATQRVEYLEDYLNALAIFKAYAEHKSFKSNFPAPAQSAQDTINGIRGFFQQNQTELSRQLTTVYLDRQTQKYADRFQSESAYVFTDDDFARIQTLINEMRDIITSSEVIDAKHKRRLLERLERMQRELHKTTSDLDRFWGFIGEAGVVMGKFGNDIKPLVDRIKELADIVWKTIAIRETLLGSGNPISLPESSPPKDKKGNLT